MRGNGGKCLFFRFVFGFLVKPKYMCLYLVVMATYGLLNPCTKYINSSAFYLDLVQII